MRFIVTFMLLLYGWLLDQCKCSVGVDFNSFELIAVYYFLALIAVYLSWRKDK